MKQKTKTKLREKRVPIFRKRNNNILYDVSISNN